MIGGSKNAGGVHSLFAATVASSGWEQVKIVAYDGVVDSMVRRASIDAANISRAVSGSSSDRE